MQNVSFVVPCSSLVSCSQTLTRKESGYMTVLQCVTVLKRDLVYRWTF